MAGDFPTGACLVFGGSGGIGRGVALEFGRAGSDVAICYRSKQDVAEQTAFRPEPVRSTRSTCATGPL